MHPGLRFATITLALVAGACAARGTEPRLPGSTLPSRIPPAPKEPAIPTDSPIVRTALALRGTQYRSGGANRAGVDCSGFVQYVYAENGIALPRGVKEQFAVGKSVALAKVQPGDLVFFATKGVVSHVGIAVDRERFVHAPNSSTLVRVDRLSTGYWAQQFAGARRIVGTLHVAQ